MDTNMKKTFQKTVIVVALLMSASSSFASSSACDATAGNLVTNCGFEAGDFTGWNVSGNDVPGEQGNLYGVEQGADPYDNTSPHSGNSQAFFADLAANATTISQNVSTHAGQSYVISFYLAQDTTPGTGESSNILDVTFGGTTLTDVSNVAVEGYTEYSFLANATSNSTALSLTLGNGLGEFLLDDVSVKANVTVPEPSSIAAVGIGLFAMLFAAQRRRAIKRY
jgi:hypothetical protein